MPKVSVIIPNYNHSIFLHQRIESVLNQTYQDFELILLDDCSTDNSKDIIELYRFHPKVQHIVYNEQNSGSTFLQWQKGIELSSGSLIWIAESDDYCEDNFLETLVPLLDQDPGASLAYCKSIRVNEKDEYMDDLSFWYEDLSANRWQLNYYNTGIEEIKKYLCYKNTIPNASAVLFNKAKAVQIDSDYLKYRLSGDWLFWINLLQKGNVVYTTATVNYFRTHNNSVRKNEEKNNTLESEKRIIINYLVKHKLINRKKGQVILSSRKLPEKRLVLRFRDYVNRLLIFFER